MNSLIIILLLLLIIAISFCFYFYNKNLSTKNNSASLNQELLSIKSVLIQTEAEKQKAEDKNRKLWQMSETVHKERKLVDEANEKLNSEKEKLEADKKKLDEKIKKLWSQSTAIHKEKERINELKLIIEEKHQEIVDSVNYAQRIQRALLATEDLLNENFSPPKDASPAGRTGGASYFVFFQPKDIVSGDFYWATTLSNGLFALVTADSTGHGVPGAIMSFLNISCIEKAIEVEKAIEPNEILNHTRTHIIETLKKDGSAEGGKDGMDCTLISFDFKNFKIHFAAANNSVWVVRDNNLIELEADSMPVGKHDKDDISFAGQTFEIKKGDMIYSSTDGFPDQFGGPKGKKFMSKKLKEFLVSISQLPVDEQKQKLSETFNSWKGNLEQIDDVTLIGVRV